MKEIPREVSNFFDIAGNIVYLADRPHLYKAPKALDDSLAHEFTHYFQYKYPWPYPRGADNDDNLEEEAVAVQRWFRATFITGKADPCGY